MISRRAGRLPLLGRDVEVGLLTRLVLGTQETPGAAAVIEGDAGLGKTRLLDQAAAAATDAGLLCLRGTCDQWGNAPFGPLLDALADASGVTAPVLRREIERTDGTTEFLLVEEIADRIESAAGGARVVLAVDDVHWADSATLATIRRLAGRLELRPLTILVALRPGHSPAVAQAVDDLLRRGAEHIRLGPLSDDVAAQLVRQATALKPGPRLRELVAGASGNPLYLVEFSRSLVEDQALKAVAGVAEVGGDHLPATFRATIGRRVRSLSEPAAGAIEAGAILGLSFTPTELAAAIGRSPSDTAFAIEEAKRAGLWNDDGDRLRFEHPLVRQAIYEDVPRSVRRQLHRTTAERLEQANAAPERVAAHVALGAERGDRGAVRRLRGIAASISRQAPGTAAELLDQARTIVSPTDPERDDLLADLAMAWATVGRLRDAEELARTILRRGADGAVIGRLRAGIVYALTWQGRPGLAVTEARRPDGSALHPTDRILLEAEGVVARVLTGDVAGVGGEIVTLEEEARRSEHMLALGHALCAATRERMLTGHLTEAIERGRLALRLAEDDPSLARTQPWFFLGLALTIADRTEEAEAVVRRGREVAEHLGLVWSLPLYMSYLANVCWLTGRWDDALAEDEAARSIAEEFGMHLAIMSASASRIARIALHRGRLDLADGALREAEAWLAEEGRQAGDALVLTARGLLLEARGETRAAQERFATAWERNLAAGIVSEMRLLAPDLVRLSLALGHVEFASSLLPDIAEMAARMDVASAEGAKLRCTGLVAGDPDVLVAAADAYRRSPRVVELAQTCEDAAVCAARRGRKNEANALLEEAAGIFGRLSASRDLTRLRAAARRYGLSGPHRPIRLSTGWPSLTASERRVATLVADGATNRQVATALFISTHTVDSHLRHVFGKLGISSRVQLAAIVARQASPEPLD